MPEDDPFGFVLGLGAFVLLVLALSKVPDVIFHLYWLLRRPRLSHYEYRPAFDAAMNEYRYKHTMALEKRNAEIARRRREEGWK